MIFLQYLYSLSVNQLKNSCCLHINQFEMLKSDVVHQFQQVLCDSTKQIDGYIKILVNPTDSTQLKFYGKIIFYSLIHLLREEYNKLVLMRIAKFVTMAIISGHFHILYMINKHLLPELVEISSGVLKFTPLSPSTNLAEVEPSKWRRQFASQLLFLLSQWFPVDLINSDKQSKYIQIVRDKKIVIKAYFIFTLQFIKKMEKHVKTLHLSQGGACQFCMKYCQKARNKKWLLYEQDDDFKQIPIYSNVQNKNHLIQQQIQPKIQLKQSLKQSYQLSTNKSKTSQQDKKSEQKSVDTKEKTPDKSRLMMQKIRDKIKEKKKIKNFQYNALHENNIQQLQQYGLTDMVTYHKR